MNRNLRLIIVAVIIGVVITLGTWLVYSRQQPPHEALRELRSEVFCQSLDAMNFTERSHGFPFTYVKMYENSCYTPPSRWQPLQFIGDVVVYSLAAGAVLYVARRRHK